MEVAGVPAEEHRMKPRSPGARFVSPVSILKASKLLPRGPVKAGRPTAAFTSAAIMAGATPKA
jgi:hypothetical protein